MNDSEWSERRREWADTTAHEDGIYLPQTAGEQVRLTASIVEFWAGRIAREGVCPTVARFFHSACRMLRYWQWQAWRGM